MNTGLETRSWKVVTRALKNEISDEANAVWLLNAQARSASADKNVSVPELKNIQEITKRETGHEVVSSHIYRLRIPTVLKDIIGKICIQMEQRNAVRQKGASSGRDRRGLQGIS